MDNYFCELVSLLVTRLTLRFTGSGRLIELINYVIENCISVSFRNWILGYCNSQVEFKLYIILHIGLAINQQSF